MATAIAEIDKAPRPGGLYYRAVGDGFIATDAEGNVVEDAPERPQDTPPEKQTGYIGPDAVNAQNVQGQSLQGGILVTPEMLQALVAAEVAKLTEPAQPTG